jgi:hypothetical protein
MVFNFFGFKKKTTIEDVEAKEPTPAAKPAPMTFEEAFAAQAAALSAAQANEATEVDASLAKAAQEKAIAEAAAAKAEQEKAMALAAAQAKAAEDKAIALAAQAAAEQAAQESLLSPLDLLAQVDASPVNAEPVKAPEGQNQMLTAKVTQEDVIAAYKIFLGRLPESMTVVDARVGVAPLVLLADFLSSKEYLDQPAKAQLVLAVAKKILDERKKATPEEVAIDANTFSK